MRLLLIKLIDQEPELILRLVAAPLANGSNGEPCPVELQQW